MASVDSKLEQAEARVRGYRTFRVRSGPQLDFWRRNDHGLARNEAVCPASAEAGHRVTCSQCMACSGWRERHRREGHRRDIAITVHGAHAIKWAGP